MRLVHDEDSEYVRTVLMKVFTTSQLEAVEFIAVDNPSNKLYLAIKSICPNLKGLILDPLHLRC